MPVIRPLPLALFAVLAFGVTPASASMLFTYPASAGSEREATAEVEFASDGISLVGCRLVVSSGDPRTDAQACVNARPVAGRGVQRQTVKVWHVPAAPVGYVPAQPAGQDNIISVDDYPIESARKKERGVVSFKYIVGVDGRVERCDILQSSGFKRLDRKTCNLVKRRYRFWPATIDGQPVRDVQATIVTYWTGRQFPASVSR